MAKAITGPQGGTCRRSAEMQNQLICTSSLWWELKVFIHWAGLPGGSDGRESAFSAGDLGSIPGWGRFPGEGDGYSLQYSCLENPMVRGGWQATERGVAESDTTEAVCHTRTQAGWLYVCLILTITTRCDTRIVSHFKIPVTASTTHQCLLHSKLFAKHFLHLISSRI